MFKATGFVLGMALVVAGLLSLAVWLWRLNNPTGADLDRMNRIADHGGVSATAPADPTKIYLYGGCAAVTAGSAMIRMSKRK